MIAPKESIRRLGVCGSLRMPAAHFCVLIVIQLIPCLARTQDTFSGGSGSSAAPTAYSDQFSTSCIQGEGPNVFKQVGMNPLACHGQQGPQDSQGKCSYAGMTMIAHVGETCYYCAPIVPPLNGIIIPFDQVRNATSQGFSCFGDQVDPDCMSVCTKPGSLQYTPSTVDKSPPVPPGEGPPPGYKPIPGPDGGVGTVTSTANPCLPQGPGGYNYCDNGPGARLPAGCSCTVTKVVTPPAETTLPPPGTKGIKNVPTPPPKLADDPTTPNIPAFEKAMVKCLSAVLPYAVPQSISPANLADAQLMGPINDINIPFAKLSPLSQIYVVETAMALQAQETHDAKYGSNAYLDLDSMYYLVGWLDHCLYDAGLRVYSSDSSPNAPFKLYGKYQGVSTTAPQYEYYLDGFMMNVTGVPPLPLKPQNPSSPTTGLLPLKPTPVVHP
jgi:hypothetical protein